MPLGTLLLLGSLGAAAQTPPEAEIRSLRTVTVRERAEAPTDKDTVRATDSTIGRGTQALRDIPQSVTVVTERLIDDRHLDTMKEVLRNTSGISFLAGEGGEEDIRLRGFSLQATGDVFVDGLRDPAFYDRDTFNLERVEVLRGSASMLFGRGSTGGAVNMVNKTPHAMDEHSIELAAGSHRYGRLVGDFNFRASESSALRLGVMRTVADNNGAGSSIDKGGLSAAWRWGIGERDEFSASFYHLDNRNGINYGLPWIRPTATAAASQTTILPLDPTAFLGMASDINEGRATYLTLSHLRRLDNGQLQTRVRRGSYDRDQRASTIRLCQGSTSSATGVYTPNAACPTIASASLASFGPNAVLTRGTQLKIQGLETLYAQTDYSGTVQALGLRHDLLAGVDLAIERKAVYGARTAEQGGVTLTKPATVAGTPDDGAWIDEASRVLAPTSRYLSRGWGVYVQDMAHLSPHWKLVGGIRYDHLVGDYDTLSITSGASTASYRMKVGQFSERVGLLWQPDERRSYHVSLANSFNTSGDAYSLSAANVNTPPEQSINFEIGARLDSEDKRFTTRIAAFRSAKLHERNTDPLVNLTTLSGKRHVAGLEIDLTGRLTPKWEIFGSWMWLPVANIDTPVTGGETGRPSLTPRHSGTIWNTVQVAPRWRVGAGLNFRGSQTPNRNPGWTVPGYTTVDLMAEFQVDSRLTFKANLNNVANRLYADQLYSGHYVAGAGRVLLLSAKLSF